MNVLTAVLEAFGIAAAEVQAVPRPGFSSASVIKVVASDQSEYCVKQTATAATTNETLSLAYRVLSQAYQSGCDFIPVPRLAVSGQPWYERGGLRWEVCNWLPGAADFNLRPSRERLHAAVEAVAQFHAAAQCGAATWGVSPAIARRLALLRQLPERYRALISANFTTTIEEKLPAARVLRRIPDLHPECQRQGEFFASRPWQLQPVHGDLWHDHLLFTGNRLAGMIDFSALKIDVPQLDWGRMVSSLRIEECIPRNEFFLSLEDCRQQRISPHEIQAIRWFGRVTLVLGTLYWIERIQRTGAECGDSSHAWERFADLCHQLELDLGE